MLQVLGIAFVRHVGSCIPERPGWFTRPFAERRSAHASSAPLSIYKLMRCIYLLYSCSFQQARLKRLVAQDAED
jgi:hypothetical protein